MKTLTHPTINKTIITTYLDHNDVEWSFEAVVTLSRCNECEDIEILWANNDVEAEFTDATWNGIVGLAGDRAMEQYEAEDFEVVEDEE